MSRHATPLFCLLGVLLVFVWSAVRPYDRVTWWLETAPVMIAVPLLLATYTRFRLTTLLYVLIALHAIVLVVGAKYTYARVPLFDDLKEFFNHSRNSYDGVGHFVQGFVPAMVARELLLRTSPLRRGKWLSALIVFSCLGISAVYEIIEYIAAIAGGGTSEAFLGTQGDPWDTQKDMALAGIGAIVALLFLSRLHDRQLNQRT